MSETTSTTTRHSRKADRDQTKDDDMTATLENETMESVSDDSAPKRRGRKPGVKTERNFQNSSEMHKDLAAFINVHPEFISAGLGSVTPEQVRAVLTLRSDFANTPEATEKREARKAAREAEKAKFAGLSAEQIKAEKAAARAEKQAEKLQARIDAIKAKAEALRNGSEATGADLAAAVESDQAGAEDKPKRRFGRGRSE